MVRARLILFVTMTLFSVSAGAHGNASARALVKRTCRRNLGANDAPSRPLRSALQILVDHARARGRHDVHVVEGRAIVDIRFLTAQNDQVFMGYLYGALKEGAVSEIRTGTIIGPKILAFLMRLNRLVPADAPLKIMGRLSAAVLETVVIDEATFFDQSSGQSITLSPEVQALLRSQQGFSRKDLREFRMAVDRLGVKDACLKFYRAATLRLCGELDFAFDARDPERVHWSVAAP